MPHFMEDPAFWVSLAFVILLALTIKPVYGKITGALDAKIAEIQARIDEAMRLREEAQEMLASAKRKLAEAQREAQTIVDEARSNAQALRTKMTEDAEASLKRRERMAMDRIAQAEADATAEIRALTADVALEATRRILAQEVQGQRAEQLVDTAISELGSKLN
jgi:F-type H+-transporting ATPase subunit b